MKLLRSVIASLSVIVCLLLSACTPNDVLSVEQPIEQRSLENTISLKSAVCIENFDLNDVCLEISVYTDECYYFNKQNKEFTKAFLSFLENTNVENTTGYDLNACDIYITFENSKDIIQSFSVNENNQVRVFDKATPIVYECEDIYKTLTAFINPYLKHNANFCRVASTPIRYMHEYAIYDKDYNVIQSDYIGREPHIFLNDSNIVHLWVQSGTGALSRWAQFFDVNNGTKSPTYYGQTDSFGNLVSATENRQVSIYDMFSGDLLYCIDKFEKPLAYYYENIVSAYFSEDGAKLIVQYFSNDTETQVQIFDLPQNLIASGVS